jgi:hypothetical protein
MLFKLLFVLFEFIFEAVETELFIEFKAFSF